MSVRLVTSTATILNTFESMLKISLMDSGNHVATLRLEGRVAGPWVTEVQKACEKLLSEGRALKLDLAEVSFVDQTGLSLLSSFRSRGISLAECSPFVAEQLKTIE